MIRSDHFNDEGLDGDMSYASFGQQDPYYDGSQADGDHTTLDYSTIPDILKLNHLCANAIAPADTTEASILEAEESWEPVREWLRNHSADEVRQAAEQRGDSSMTALHFACRHQPPIDVVNVFLSIALETVQWPDTFGWLPIHYACACGAHQEVITKLAEAFAESKTTVDRRGRTPLHFALGNASQSLGKLASPDVIAVLSSSGAAAYADDNGMLPLHYACAYGTSGEALFVLTGAYPEAISTRDRNNRTPLHFALSNASRAASPGAVRHLLELDPSLANSNGGALPLRVLADFSQTLKSEDDASSPRASVLKCLEHLLNANPDPTADFFTALQALPSWLQERAVVLPSVQVLLNEKISQRFPTLILMGDFYFLVVIIVAYSVNVTDSINRRFGDQPDAVSPANLSPLYIGAVYFIAREIIQIISLISLKSFHIWVYDLSNWLNLIFIVAVLYWTILMQTGGGDNNWFRIGTAVTVAILWLKVLAYLRNMLIDFAVFSGGVFYVFRRLVAFLTALMIILIGFAQMFVTVYQDTPYCLDNAPSNSTCPSDLDDVRTFCNYWEAFLTVYTMLLGEVNEELFADSTVATILFVVFMFLVVILLANVLIAIVTDSYKIIQDQRAAIEFWTNRLDFVAEMDAIANGPWKKRIRRFFSVKEGPDSTGHVDVSFGREFWKRLMDLFEDDLEDNVVTVEFWAYNLLRLFAALVIIPSWILLGLLTAGWLWPPQLRELLFTSTVAQHSSESEREDELRRTQVIMLQNEVEQLKEDILQELKVERMQVVQMKSLIAERRAEIASEMRDIKRIMTMLFDQQAASMCVDHEFELHLL